MQAYSDSKIVLTRRAKELAAALGLMAMALLSMPYPLDPKTGWWMGQGVFLVVFGLTYLREERRARHSPFSKAAVLYKRAEDLGFTLSVAGFYLWAFILHSDWSLIYACLITYVVGLLSGLLAGELLWQHLRLPQVEEIWRNRYWAAYNDSIIPPDARQNPI